MMSSASPQPSTNKKQKFFDWMVTVLVAIPAWLLAARLLYAFHMGGNDEYGDEDKRDIATIFIFMVYAGCLLLITSTFMATRKFGWPKYLAVNAPLFVVIFRVFI